MIGAETFSRILDWQDRTTCVLFGDGAGAVVLEAQAQTGTRDDRGILATRIRSDGKYEDLLYVDGGPGSTRTTGHLRMNGREVFRHAVTKISGVIEETLHETGYTADEIDLFVPHQANARILDGIARKLKVSPEKIVMTLPQQGNTSAASIPLALNEAWEAGRVKEGGLVLMEAMGGGSPGARAGAVVRQRPRSGQAKRDPTIHDCPRKSAFHVGWVKRSATQLSLGAG